MRLHRPWFLTPYLYRGAIFRIKTTEKILSLTFDDGPDPSSTTAVLEILERYNIRAIFFCCGRAAADYPELMARTKSGGHIIGNHGFIHIDGFLTSVPNYVENIKLAEKLTSAVLFRPPYGRLRPAQYRKIRTSYRVVMWDLMAYDFDRRAGREEVLNLLKKRIRKGSIIVLHDKQGSTVTGFLEDLIRYCLAEGYRFVIPSFIGEEAD